MVARTNVVLVHGVWADGSSSSKVVPLLDEKGLNVIAVQLPSGSLEDDVAVTKNALAELKRPALMVGDSYGAAVIS